MMVRYHAFSYFWVNVVYWALIWGDQGSFFYALSKLLLISFLLAGV